MAYFLPHLLALSCSSPFWGGRDTGLKSYRLTIFDALPRTGVFYQGLESALVWNEACNKPAKPNQDLAGSQWEGREVIQGGGKYLAQREWIGTPLLR